jgi:hypothetical protein
MNKERIHKKVDKEIRSKERWTKRDREEKIDQKE